MSRINPPSEAAGWGRALCFFFGHPRDRQALKIKPRGHLAIVCIRCGDEIEN